MFCDKEGVKEKKITTLIQEVVRSDEHKSYKLKWAGEKNSKAYNMEGMKQKEDTTKIKTDAGKK